MKKNKPYNPFLIAGYYSPDYFCDREQETLKIISALENDRNISLMSPRRFGKTGLIHHVFYRISEKNENAVCIYFDIFSGSRQHLMSEIFLSAKRPFYQSTQIMSLDAINKDNYFQFANAHFQKSNHTITEECFNLIYLQFEGHTWYVQALLKQGIEEIDR